MTIHPKNIFGDKVKSCIRKSLCNVQKAQRKSVLDTSTLFKNSQYQIFCKAKLQPKSTVL